MSQTKWMIFNTQCSVFIPIAEIRKFKGKSLRLSIIILTSNLNENVALTKHFVCYHEVYVAIEIFRKRLN